MSSAVAASARYRKPMAFAILLALVSAVAMAMAIYAVGQVQIGAVSPFAVLLWAAGALVSGLGCLVTAAIATVRARKARPGVG